MKKYIYIAVAALICILTVCLASQCSSSSKYKALYEKELQYQLGQATKIDTITVSDTIFVPKVDIDTTIGDYWYNLRLQMKYPSTIVTTPTFNSEQYIYVYNEKKYVGGKSKCFFINWFKKTYISTEVKVEEKNPHIKITNQKFIKIEGNE